MNDTLRKIEMKTENIVTKQPIAVTKDFCNKNILQIYDTEIFVIKIPNHTDNITIANINALKIETKRCNPRDLMIDPYILEWLDKKNFSYEDIKECITTK